MVYETYHKMLSKFAKAVARLETSGEMDKTAKKLFDAYKKMSEGTYELVVKVLSEMGELNEEHVNVVRDIGDGVKHRLGMMVTNLSHLIMLAIVHVVISMVDIDVLEKFSETVATKLMEKGLKIDKEYVKNEVKADIITKLAVDLLLRNPELIIDSLIKGSSAPPYQLMDEMEELINYYKKYEENK